MITGSPIIEVSRLVKKYRGASDPAVNNISFSVSENEIFGLLGPNGAGKTTTINILCGILQPTGGSVKIGRFGLSDEYNKIKRIIGVVPQDIALYPTLTAIENLTIFGYIHGLRGKALRVKIQSLLELFGLEKNRDIRISKYSGGMKRRLNLVAGILHDPKVLFLDEPTVGIDVQSKTVILENLLRINKKGTTMIYTSHQMEEAESLCSQIAIIDEGKIITEGNPAQLIGANQAFRNLEDVYLNRTGKKLRD